MPESPAIGPTISMARELCERRLRDATLVGARRSLIEAALTNSDRIPLLRLPACIVRLIASELSFLATADEETFARYCAKPSRVERLWRIVTLQRFPAGQFEWEISGISRSDLVRVAPLTLPRVAWFCAFRMHGLRPVFFSHLNPRRPQQPLDEHEANRSYHRMARAMALQPEVRGFAACSWFRSPSTHRASPRLAWLSTVFIENGGLVVDAGRDSEDSGALARSATRRHLYETGKFVPRRGLVMWPRSAMIEWADAHPEFADQTDTPPRVA
jgi:hypothetical protein